MRKQIRKFVKNWITCLVALAIIFIGAGFYLNTEPEWTRHTFPDYYNQGVSDYIKDQKDAAYGQFGHVAQLSEDPGLKSLAFYNAGTMLGEVAVDPKFSAQSRFQIAQLAIENLKEALRQNPDNEEAKHNLEYIRNILPKLFSEMQKEQQGQEGQPQPGPGYGPGGEDKGF